MQVSSLGRPAPPAALWASEGEGGVVCRTRVSFSRSMLNSPPASPILCRSCALACGALCAVVITPFEGALGRKDLLMLERRELFPHVIELNHQARRRFGCCVYLIHSAGEWALIDVGYDDTVPEIVELIRQMDFPLSGGKYFIATHADVDHVQGFRVLQDLIPSGKVVAHPHAQKLLAEKDRIMTYAEISAQGISLDLPDISVEVVVDEGSQIQVGDLQLDVWHTPGHAQGQLAFRMGNLLFSGDNIFRDGCVGNIDAHHGSDLPDFIQSLERIRDSDVEWLLPSHGPIFRNDRGLLQSTINRLTGYQHMADFGTCALDWPLLDAWEEELIRGVNPTEG